MQIEGAAELPKSNIQPKLELITLEEYEEYREEYIGVCLACGERQDSVEPDARNYPCDTCGEQQVFGIEELLIMGCVG